MTIKKNSERNDLTNQAGHGGDEALGSIVELTEEECELVAGGLRKNWGAAGPKDQEVPVITDRC
jgi:hypothetical protein